VRRALLGLALAVFVAASPAAGALPVWVTHASYEGLVGHRTACGVRITTTRLATASHYPCGTRLTIWYHGHKARVTSEDSGPYVYGRRLDIWDATARKLGFRNGHAFGVRTVTFVYGWH